MIYHVSINGSDHAAGTQDAPFRTINHAAQIAQAGDTVRVHTGEYREWIDPRNGGQSEEMRIVYEAAPGEHPVVKGSEIITDWQQVEGTVWKKILPNRMFGDWNPYVQKVEGDWLVEPTRYSVHLGDVYLNGISMFEATSLEDLYTAEMRSVCCQNSWRIGDELIRYPERTVYRWYAEVDGENTTILCNFQDKDPNRELVEINVRKCCFYPGRTGVNYITIRGFEFAHAACPFSPPTSEQFGMVGAHWSKGWIIENNDLHDAKCSAISIGKDAASGDNLHFHVGRKSGYRHQLEAVFHALKTGWSKETVGSHIIRNNVIHDCGQNGIVGHLGCVFSRIEHNHIYNIGVKHEYWGHEMGGIKLHAPIDVVIENNNIHDCTLGTWLDWQVQGTRITRNLYYRNNRDFMIEVTHGPCVIDHNLFLSRYSIDHHAQGIAFVHNLVLGCVWPVRITNRATPYHFPNSTQVAGYTAVYGGDDRVFNNLFLGVQPDVKPRVNFCEMYDAYTTPEEYLAQLQPGERYIRCATYQELRQPVMIAENAYAGHAKPFRAELDPIAAEGMSAELTEADGEWILTLNMPESAAAADCRAVSTERLGKPIITEAPYTDPMGMPLDFSRDMIGVERKKGTPGPFADPAVGEQQIVVWRA